MAVHLQRQIESLKQKILFVGTLVEEALAKSVSALVNRDRHLAKTVIDEDAEIDRMEVEVEESMDLPAALEITMPVSRASGGDLSYVSDPRFAPLAGDREHAAAT